MNLFGGETHAAEVLIGNVGSKAAYTGAGTTSVSWMMSNEAGVVIGIAIGIIGIVLSWYYKRKRDLREEEEHRSRMCERCMKRTIRMYSTGEFLNEDQ